MAAPDSYVSPLKRRIRAALESAAVAEAAASESTYEFISPSKRRVRAALARGEPAPSPVVEAKSEQPQPEAEDRTFKINRAPVVTLWVAVVAERQGFSWHTGLACGRAVASIFSNAKGKRLGIISEKPKKYSGQQGAGQKAEGGAVDEDGMTEVKVFGMQLKGVERQDGFQPLAEDGKPIQPDRVEKYLKRSFGAHFDAAKRSLEMLAASWSPEELHDSAYRMYERFRPSVMDGAAGWGQHSTLDLDVVESLCGKQACG